MAALLNVVQRVPSLLNPVVGIIADRIAVRYFLIWAPAIASVSMSLLGIAPYYILLVVLLLIMGIGSTLFHVPGPVMIKQVAAKQTGTGMSYYMLGGEVARTIGPLTILGAVSLWGLEGTFRLIPFGLFASFLLYLRVRKIPISDALKTDRKLTDFKNTLFRMMPFFIILIGFTLFRSIMKASLTTFLPVYITSKGESLWLGGISLSLVQFAGAIGTFLGGTISDRIGRKTTLLIISISAPILMWIFINLEGWLTFPLLIIIGFLIIAPTPVMLALVQDQNSKHPAFVNGIYMTINFTIGAIAVVGVGAMGDWMGLEMTFRISAMLSLLTIPFVMKLP
jgi:FSR family fosmidomycin resistance protein-like MFS transporter